MTPEPLSPKRKPKNCSLSETTIEYISHYAQQHNLSFSHAIEGLALLSLRDQRMAGMVELMRETMRRELRTQYNRFAKLLVHTAIEAGAAKEAAQHVYFLQLLREMDELQPLMAEQGDVSMDAFADLLAVSPDTPEGSAVINLFKQRRGRFRYRAVKALRRPIAEFDQLLDEMAQWAEAIKQRAASRVQKQHDAK